MNKQEYMKRREYILKLMKEGKYKTALIEADQIDWNRISNVNMLMKISVLYDRCGHHDKSVHILENAYRLSDGNLAVLRRMCVTAVLAGDIEGAEACFKEYVGQEPSKQQQLITRYRMMRAARSDIEKQIRILEDMKKVKYTDQWGYELAKKYEEAGMIDQCIEECDHIILWFGTGDYAKKAEELRQQYVSEDVVQADDAAGAAAFEGLTHTEKLESISEWYEAERVKKAREMKQASKDVAKALAEMSE